MTTSCATSNGKSASTAKELLIYLLLESKNAFCSETLKSDGFGGYSLASFYFLKNKIGLGNYFSYF